MHSLIHIKLFNKNDTVLQLVRCLFDTHVQDIMGTLMIGATLVMLHPRGNMDFIYISTVLEKQQITCITYVPSLLLGYFTFLKEANCSNAIKSLRTVCTGGT